MITVKEAKKKFNEKYPNLNILKGYLLKSSGKTYYLFYAPEGDYISEDDSFYAVDRNSGAILTYAPMADFENFKNVGKHPIQV